jgi:hypothetical protein
MKGYCDPSKHEHPFNGWGMGGQNMCDLHLVLKRLVHLIHDGLLESGQHDWMHFLGTSKLEWAVTLTIIQRAIRQYHNPTFTISFDCASPFLATANGQLYHSILTDHRRKWSYSMDPTADDKKYATDSRSFRDAVMQDGIHPNFEDSPISARLKISDVCYYKPGDLNKIGKEGRTSWDSFSYALLMGHNVWMHIESVQRANRLFDSEKDNKLKYLLFRNNIINSIQFKDDTEVYISDDNELVTKGLFFYQHKDYAVRNVTDKDFSVYVSFVNNTAQEITNLTTGAIQDKIVVLYTRKAGVTKNLVYSAPKMHELYKLPQNVELDVLLSSGSSIADFRAETLENSDYFKVSNLTAIKNLSVDMAIGAMGYGGNSYNCWN